MGSEITKLRPALVVSYNEIGRLPLKTVVPIMDWKENYLHHPWIIQIESDVYNGLSKISGIDCFQVKNFSNERFKRQIGNVNDNTLCKIHTIIAKTLNPSYELSI